MNDKIILKTEDNVIKEVVVVDDSGEKRTYEPDTINFAELEHEDIMETLKDKKEKLSKIVEYSMQRLEDAKKANKKFAIFMAGIFIISTILFIVRDPLFPFDMNVVDVILDFICSFIVTGVMSGFGAILLKQYQKTLSHDYSYAKSNLEQVTKDLEKEKEKETEKSKDEIEFQLKNERLEELDRKYERTYGSFYTDIDDTYASIMELEEENPKTFGSIRRK